MKPDSRNARSPGRSGFSVHDDRNLQLSSLRSSARLKTRVRLVSWAFVIGAHGAFWMWPSLTAHSITDRSNSSSRFTLAMARSLSYCVGVFKRSNLKRSMADGVMEVTGISPKRSRKTVSRILTVRYDHNPAIFLSSRYAAGATLMALYSLRIAENNGGASTDWPGYFHSLADL